jgi:predicted RNA binding protein YcfA (HicA-like mRNA interferase family)
MNGYEKQVKDILKQNGWQLLRHGKGSHDIWTDGKRCVSVNHECRSRHTANAIMKDAGIKHKF